MTVNPPTAAAADLAWAHKLVARARTEQLNDLARYLEQNLNLLADLRRSEQTAVQNQPNPFIYPLR